MAKYKKKQVIIDAWQWEGSTLSDAYQFCNKHGLPKFAIGNRKGGTGMIIPTPKGDLIAYSGDYIIKIDGKYYPCKKDIFVETYEPFYS